jgi:hypothetical protein
LRLGINIVEWQCGDEGGKSVRIFPADLGQTIVGNASKLGGHHGRADRFQGRIGERKDLAQSVKAFDEPQTGVDIDKRIEPRECRDRDVIGNELGNAVEIGPRHEMIEYVDDQSRALTSLCIRKAEFSSLVEHRARRCRDASRCASESR